MSGLSTFRPERSLVDTLVRLRLSEQGARPQAGCVDEFFAGVPKRILPSRKLVRFEYLK
jgi:hypothetical protein